MSKGTLYLFGAFSLVGLSLQLHFASYGSDGIDIYALVISNIGAILLALIIAFALHIVFPDEEPRTPLPKAAKELIATKSYYAPLSPRYRLLYFKPST